MPATNRPGFSISPAGFELYFEEVIALPADVELPDRIARIASIVDRYELELDFASVPGLVEEFNLVFGAPPQS
ncbi:MAG: hypothetical protein ACR2ME_02290 [Acidimicrobiia bacterium]